MTGKKQTMIYDADDAAGAEKRGWDGGLIVESTVRMEEAPAGRTKKCPYCAEEIQADAVKCRHCGEWLDGSPSARPAAGKIPWYFRTSFIVIALGCIGPLALPLIWWRPQTSRAWKIGLTIVIVAVSVILFQMVMQSLQHLQEYYKMLDSLRR